MTHSPYAKRGLGRPCLPKILFLHQARATPAPGGEKKGSWRACSPPNLPHRRCLRKVSCNSFFARRAKKELQIKWKVPLSFASLCWLCFGVGGIAAAPFLHPHWRRQ